MNKQSHIINLKAREILREQLDKSNYAQACDSATWYMSSEQTEAYKKTHASEEYNEIMHYPEIQMLEGNEERMINVINLFQKDNKVQNKIKNRTYDIKYVDCGPGTADKTQILLDEMLRQKIKIDYIAIDVNEEFLKNAIKIVSPKVARATGYLGNFMDEFDLRACINDSWYEHVYEFVNLGATFSNYKISEIVQNFFWPSQDVVIYLSAQIVETEDDIKRTIKAYSNEELYKLGRAALKNLHINSDEFDTITKFNRETRCIEHILKINKNVFDERAREFEGKEIKVFESYKPPLSEFKKAIEKYLTGEFYTDEENKFAGFIGTLKKRT